MTTSDLWDLFHGATRVLVGAGPVKQRLIDAWRVHLASLREQDVPDGMQARFAALRNAMHGAHPAGGLTAAEASVRKMSDRDATEHAAAILGMFATLSAHAGPDVTAAPRLRVVGRVADEDGELPGYLSRA